MPIPIHFDDDFRKFLFFKILKMLLKITLKKYFKSVTINISDFFFLKKHKYLIENKIYNSLMFFI